MSAYQACSPSPQGRWRVVLLACVLAVALHAAVLFAWQYEGRRPPEFAGVIGDTSMEVDLVGTPLIHKRQIPSSVFGKEIAEFAAEIPPIEPAPISTPIPSFTPGVVASIAPPLSAPECSWPPSPTISPRPVPPKTKAPESVTSTQKKSKSGVSAKPNFNASTAHLQAVETSKTKVAYLHNPQPPYPAQSRRAGHAGTVILCITVNERGKAISARVAKSSGYAALDQQALTTVRDHWRFQPALSHGVPTATKVSIPIRFLLHADEN